MTDVLTRGGEDTHAYREEGHVKMEAEIRVMLPQVKEYKGLLRAEAMKRQGNVLS